MNLLKSVGFKTGEMAVYSAGRGDGKSLYNINLCEEILLPVKPEPQYKFSRAKWHIVDYDWKDFVAVGEWCVEQFGPQPLNPDAWCRWYQRGMGRIHFRDWRDAALFILRWS